MGAWDPSSGLHDYVGSTLRLCHLPIPPKALCLKIFAIIDGLIVCACSAIVPMWRSEDSPRELGSEGQIRSGLEASTLRRWAISLGANILSLKASACLSFLAWLLSLENLRAFSTSSSGGDGQLTELWDSTRLSVEESITSFFFSVCLFECPDVHRGQENGVLCEPPNKMLENRT